MSQKAKQWFAVQPINPDPHCLGANDGKRVALAAMSHNGSARARSQDGTFDAFRTAYDAGYRWFQVDVLASKDELISRHSWFGRKRRFRRKKWTDLKDEYPDVPTLRELLASPELAGARWNIEMKSRQGEGMLRDILDWVDSQQHLAEAQRETAVRLQHLMISCPMRPKVLRRLLQGRQGLVEPRRSRAHVRRP